jgi:hypothetical protein
MKLHLYNKIFVATLYVACPSGFAQEPKPRGPASIQLNYSILPFYRNFNVNFSATSCEQNEYQEFHFMHLKNAHLIPACEINYNYIKTNVSFII